MQVFADGQARRHRYPVQNPGQQQPRDRQHDDRHGNTHRHPTRKADIEPVILGEVAYQQGVGRRADECR